MRRRRRDSRPVDDGHGTSRERAEFRKEQRLVEVLRRVQIAAALIMLCGVTTSTLVCAGEFKLPWLIATGGGVFLLGLVLFGVARPLARWWTASR